MVKNRSLEISKLLMSWFKISPIMAKGEAVVFLRRCASNIPGFIGSRITSFIRPYPFESLWCPF
jgi:hypothetical protein